MQRKKYTRRTAIKKGVSVPVVKFGDEFVKGIKAIYDESPLRQGRRFRAGAIGPELALSMSEDRWQTSDDLNRERSTFNE